MNFDLYKHARLITLAGSRAYGIHTAESDVDLKGMAVPPASYYIGLDRFEQADSPEHFADPRFTSLLSGDAAEAAKTSKVEGTVYEYRKCIRLLLDGNPNMLDILFCRDEDVLVCGKVGEDLRNNRDLFLTKRLRHTLSGYAISQLKRIKLHYGWVHNPPSGPASRKAFDLPEATLMPADQLNAAFALVKAKLDSWQFDFSLIESEAVRQQLLQQIESTMTEIVSNLDTGNSYADDLWNAAARSVGIDTNLLDMMERERRYRAAKDNWDHYQTWLRNRNPARAALEAKHGYDTKHAAHLYRLLVMCEEFLQTGKLHVWRGDRDADQIRAIRGGSMSYDELLNMAKVKDETLSHLYKNAHPSIPHSPDMAKVGKVVEAAISHELGM